MQSVDFTHMSRTSAWYIAATFFFIAALVWGLTGQPIGFALIAVAAVMLVLGLREGRR